MGSTSAAPLTPPLTPDQCNMGDAPFVNSDRHHGDILPLKKMHMSKCAPSSGGKFHTEK